jgi:hypothetical protein
VVPRNVKDSLLLAAIRHQDDLEMPPKKKLSDEVIADFARWIEMGAPDPRQSKALKVNATVNIEEGRKFWAFQKPVRKPAPSVADTAWPLDDIDRFLLAELESKGLKPSPDADRATLIRRVYFDLIGLPPSPAEAQAFIDDPSPQALEKVVDRLLASPRFGERWGRHWLDAARYGESTGMERNHTYPHAWRYRDYVIDSFNDDKKYNDFIREQIAGDLLSASGAADGVEQTVATGFLAIGPKSLNERNREQFLMDIVDEQIDVTTRAVIGLTVSCARCHDHKFDPFTTNDYYSLAGIFRSTQVFYGTANTQGNRQPGKLMPLGASDSQAAATPGSRSQSAPDESDRRKLEQVKRKIAELAQQAKAAKKSKNAQDKRRELAAEYQKLNAEKNRLEAKLGTTGDSASGGSPDFAMAVSEGKVGDIAVCIRGEPDNRGPVVPRQFPQVFGVNGRSDLRIPPQQSGRLQLAAWLSSADHPLTARVAVNRIWHNLMGRGIVDTLDNFGATGSRPTHPALLDYLAVRFTTTHQWSVKKMIRQIVLSRAYRQASRHDDKSAAVDPENRLLWRANVRRLDAESIRDSVLAAAGTINFDAPRGSLVSELGDGEVGRRLSTERFDVSGVHRSVYLPIVRGAVPSALSVFDFAEPSLVVGARDVTTVPAQALYMMNNRFVIQQSEAMARRVIAQSPAADAATRVGHAYQLALARRPNVDEARRGVEFLQATGKALAAAGKAKDTDADHQALTTFCQALLASAEFRYLD